MKILVRWSLGICSVMAFYMGAMLPLVGESPGPYMLAAAVLALGAMATGAES